MKWLHYNVKSLQSGEYQMSVYLSGFPYTTITWTWTHGYCNLSDLDTVFSECCDKLRKLMVPHTVMNMYLGLQVRNSATSTHGPVSCAGN